MKSSRGTRSAARAWSLSGVRSAMMAAMSGRAACIGSWRKRPAPAPPCCSGRRWPCSPCCPCVGGMRSGTLCSRCFVSASMVITPCWTDRSLSSHAEGRAQTCPGCTCTRTLGAQARHAKVRAALLGEALTAQDELDEQACARARGGRGLAQQQQQQQQQQRQQQQRQQQRKQQQRQQQQAHTARVLARATHRGGEVMGGCAARGEGGARRGASHNTNQGGVKVGARVLNAAALAPPGQHGGVVPLRVSGCADT